MTNPSQPQSEGVNVEEYVRKYIQLRDKKAEIKAAYERQIAPIDEVMGKVEALLLDKLNELGAESMRTPAGTAYVGISTSVGLADYKVYEDFCAQQPDPFVFFERRVSKAAVEQYKADHGELPPGLNWTETRTVKIRRS